MFKIAFRNVFRQKRRSILTVLTMLGGFVLSAFSFGWSDGTYDYIIDMFTRNQMGHIQIHEKGYLDRPALYKTIDDYVGVGLVLDSIPDVVAWSPRVYSSGLVSVGEKSSGARIIGIDPVREQNATRFDKKIVDGRSFSEKASHESVLGKGLATVLKASVGDSIVVVSQGADGSIANDIYAIIGIMESGDDMSDQSAFYLHMSDAQDLLVLDNRVHEIIVIGKDLDEVTYLATTIRQALNNPNLSVAPWQEFARAFYDAMMADKQGTWIMLAIIVLIAAIGVLNTVLMTVLERRREYGVLRALGTRPTQIFRLVLIEVAVMALVSLVVGSILSYIINSYFSSFGVSMPQTFTYGGMEFKTMYTEINARSFYIPAITVAISALLVSIFPAAKAARIAPARAMRMH